MQIVIYQIIIDTGSKYINEKRLVNYSNPYEPSYPYESNNSNDIKEDILYKYSF